MITFLWVIVAILAIIGLRMTLRRIVDNLWR